MPYSSCIPGIFTNAHLEPDIVDGEHVLVGGEEVGVLVLPEELVRGHRLGVDCLEHDFLPGPSMLRQVDTGKPSLADFGDDVVFLVEVNLKKNTR